MFIIFLVYGNFSSLRYVIRKLFQFMRWNRNFNCNPEIFPVNRNLSCLWDGNWNFNGLHYVTWKYFCCLEWKLELSRNSNLRNKFLDHSISKKDFFPEKWKPASTDMVLFSCWWTRGRENQSFVSKTGILYF